MQRHKRIAKTIAILLSTSLAGLFIAYRSGVFDKQIQSSVLSESSPLTDTTGKDSLKKEPVLMSSSKVIIIPKEGAAPDKRQVYMGGSKSGLVSSPDRSFPPDSAILRLLADTSYKQKSIPRLKSPVSGKKDTFKIRITP